MQAYMDGAPCSATYCDVCGRGTANPIKSMGLEFCSDLCEVEYFVQSQAEAANEPSMDFESI